MGNRKDIFDLFRDNEHKLSHAPSPRSWRRLERRLDSHRNRHRHSFVRSFAIVAAVALLAVFTFLSTIGFGEQRERLFALGGSSGQLEQLAYSDADFDQTTSMQMVMIAQHAQEQRRSTISEGTALQKLVPNGQNKDKQAALLPQFYWLEGKWQSLSADGQVAVLEDWSTAGSNALIGTAKKAGKVIERMKLEERNNRLSFVSDFGTGNDISYTLVALNQREATFENRNAGFPEQVVLRRESPSRLTVIYQNAGLDISNADRVAALQQRHNLSSQRAVRKMARLALQ